MKLYNLILLYFFHFTKIYLNKLLKFQEIIKYYFLNKNNNKTIFYISINVYLLQILQISVI